MYVGRSMSKFRRQISGRAFNFLVSAFPETSPVRQIFYLLRMVMHASHSDTLAKFSPLRQTVEGFVVDLVRDVSVPVFVKNLYLLLVNFDGPVLGCLENCNQLKAHVSSILCGTEMYVIFHRAKLTKFKQSSSNSLCFWVAQLYAVFNRMYQKISKVYRFSRGVSFLRETDEIAVDDQITLNLVQFTHDYFDYFLLCTSQVMNLSRTFVKN